MCLYALSIDMVLRWSGKPIRHKSVLVRYIVSDLPNLYVELMLL